jgi:hypothetical protein
VKDAQSFGGASRLTLARPPTACDDAKEIFPRKPRPYAVYLYAHVGILLSHADHDTRMARFADDRRRIKERQCCANETGTGIVTDTGNYGQEQEQEEG